MPLPPHVLLGTERTRRGPLQRWWHRPPRRSVQPSSPVERQPLEAGAPDESRESRESRGSGTDTPTRAFWGRSASTATTSRRVADLVDAHERGRDRAPTGRPRGNPAFSEALFVELMRAHQYRRAFGLLSDDCQQSWGSADAFASAQGSSAMRRLRGVNVREIRFLPDWTDPARGVTYHEVAELSVEYTVGDRDPARVIPRVVHLVPDGGRWRSICYPM